MLSQVTDGDGNVTTIERNASGQPVALVAPFGQRTTLTLDANGYLASLTNPAGESYRMSCSPQGLLTRFENPNQQATTFRYDALGRLLQEQDAAGGSQSLTRTERTDGYQVALTTALNRSTTYQVETLSTGERRWVNTYPDATESETRLGTDASTRTTLADGTVTTLLEGPDPRFGMQAPVAERLTTMTGGLTATLATTRTVSLADPTDPLSLITLTEQVTLNGRSARRVFEAATRTTTRTSAAGRQSSEVIDAQGRLTQAHVPGLLAVTASYDSRGRLSTLTQGSGAEARTTTFGYSAGYLHTLTDPLNRILSYDYDAAGRVLKTTLPDGRAIHYRYDPNGNLLALTPPGRPAYVFIYTPVDLQAQYTPPALSEGGNTTYSYNADRQLTTLTRPDGTALELTYDEAGRLSALALPEGLYLYAYNNLGQLGALLAPSGVVLNYHYRGALPASVDWGAPLPGSVEFSYDTDFRLSQLTVNGTTPIAYHYDADSLLIQAGDLTLSRNAQNGLLTGTTLGTLSDSLSYNGFGEVVSYRAQAGATPLLSLDYTRDALGRITRTVETLGGVTTTDDYAYDRVGRLIEVQRNGTAAGRYTYDANGNRLSKTTPAGSETGSYDDQDRLLSYGNTTYTYTANGELRTKTVGGQTTRYQYDALGNLLAVELPNGTRLEYLVDGQNRRVGKKVNGTLVQGFLYQDQLEPIAELDGSGQVVARFVYADQSHVPAYLIKSGRTYRILSDHLGSPRLVIDTSTGAVAQRLDYDEFGNVLIYTNPGFQPFGLQGDCMIPIRDWYSLEPEIMTPRLVDGQLKIRLDLLEV